MTIDWTPEYDRKLLALRHGTGDGLQAVGRSFAEIARRMNAWFGVEHFTKDNVQKRYRLITPPPSLADFPPARPTPYLSRYFDADGKLIGRPAEREPLEARLSRLHAESRPITTLVLSDTQGVFCDEEKLAAALDAHPDADIIMLPGDVADWENVSRYDKTRDIPLVYECDWLVRLYELLEQRYPDSPVIVTNSNHRRRVEHAVRQLPSSLLFLVEHNPERYLAQPFRNVYAIESWWIQVGDVIYAHMEGRTRQPGDNVRDAIDRFLLEFLQRRVGRFNVVVTGHSHKVATIKYKTILGIEPGTLARLPLPYQESATVVDAVQENGYAVVAQKRGEALLNECRVYHF